MSFRYVSTLTSASHNRERAVRKIQGNTETRNHCTVTLQPTVSGQTSQDWFPQDDQKLQIWYISYSSCDRFWLQGWTCHVPTLEQAKGQIDKLRPPERQSTSLSFVDFYIYIYLIQECDLQPSQASSKWIKSCDPDRPHGSAEKMINVSGLKREMIIPWTWQVTPETP